jgi:hypothetical protein
LERSSQFYSNLLQPGEHEVVVEEENDDGEEEQEVVTEEDEEEQEEDTINQPLFSTQVLPSTTTATTRSSLSTTTATIPATQLPPPISNGCKPIKVVVRVRPIIHEDVDEKQCVYVDSESSLEPLNTTAAAAAAAADDDDDKNIIRLSKEYYDDRCFKDFEHVLNSTSTQKECFDVTCQSAISNVLQGINSTILCYGQTGSGKTYTMFGNEKHPGLVSVDAEDELCLNVRYIIFF